MTSLARFGTVRQKTHPIHPAEKRLLGIVLLHLCFLPWALGTMHVWSQAISFSLSALEFAIALRRRDYGAELTHDGRAYRLVMWPKLMKFPIFWIGVVFLLYILIQALNPAWRYVAYDSSWWLVRMPHIAWLPTGMITPVALASPWRSLMIYGSAWMTPCALWVGFTRRRTLRIFFFVLACNAFALALLGISERALHADLIFWSWRPPAGYFVASFIYKNHAGAYFDLLLSLSVALAVWHYTDPRSRLKKSNPSGLFVLFSLALALIVFYSYSRTATILMLFLFVLVLLLLIGTLIRQGRSQRPGVIALLCCTTFGALGALGLTLLPTKEVLAHMDELVKVYQSPAPGARQLATRATLDLVRDSPVYGWGAGSFRFAFPIHQPDYPAIYIQDGKHLYWEHAHNDYVELLAELGLVGTAILALGGICWLVILCRTSFWRNPLSLILFTGCVITLVHSTVDFNFYNPAILITWCAFLSAIARWAELNRSASNS